MKKCTREDVKDLCLTVYNDGFGLVAERRTVDLNGSEDRLQYMDVAQRIEVESLRVKGVDVAEVNYEYDLVDKARLLRKYIGEVVYLQVKDNSQKRACRLLSAGSGLVLEDTASGEVLVDVEGELILPRLPQGLTARPALVFQLQPGKSKEMEVLYLTQGLSWETHYVVELQEGFLGLDAWVEVRNESGISFTDTRLKLLAGEVNRVCRELEDICYNAEYVCERSAVEFEEKSFSDYHLYTMEGVTTLKDNQSKQVRLFGVDGVPYRKYYEVAPYSEDARIVVEISNTSGNHLGLPFPAGTCKVYQKDEADQGLTFIGEDQIDHTPKDETVRLYIGEAFDLRCTRKCLSKVNSWGIKEEKWRIVLKNHKEETATMRVIHNVPRIAQVEESSHFLVRRSADQVMFEVELPPDTIENIEFTVVTDERVHVVKQMEKEK